jgi:hypothetical protein
MQQLHIIPTAGGQGICGGASDETEPNQGLPRATALHRQAYSFTATALLNGNKVNYRQASSNAYPAKKPCATLPSMCRQKSTGVANRKLSLANLQH